MQFRRLLLPVFMALAFAAVASRAVVGQRARSTLDGVSYTIRVTSSRRAAGAATASPGERYVGHGVFAANRGRLEIVEGAADPVFNSGDYVLFDTSDLIVVHPATRDFVAVPRDSTLPALDSLSALGVQITLSDVKVTLDSISAGDTVAGFPTMHYRMTTAFNMTVDAAIMVQRVGTESVTDYWVALVPGLPNNPLLRANGIPGSDLLGQHVPRAVAADRFGERAHGLDGGVARQDGEPPDGRTRSDDDGRADVRGVGHRAADGR